MFKQMKEAFEAQQAAAACDQPHPKQVGPRRKVVDAPVQSATVTTAQGVSEADKITTTVPGGVPGPDHAVARSTLPKEDSFGADATTQAQQFISDTVDHAPAGLLGSLVGDIQDVSYAYLDVDLLRHLQARDQKKKGLAQGAVAHAICTELLTALAAHQKEKYGTRGCSVFRDASWGMTANEFYLTTHAELLDGGNSRTGSWTAKWKIACQNIAGVNEAELSGDVRARSWCYEDCTAHMRCNQEFQTVTLQADAESSIAKVLVKQIVDWEKETFAAITTVYDKEMDGTLKQIRRILPITRTRLKWELIANRAVKKRELKRLAD